MTSPLHDAPRIRYDRLSSEDVLANQYIRLNTIYQIVDKDGNLVPFRMNPEQYDLYRNMHNLNLVLKARQLGLTTIIQLFMLDMALFTPNTSCGVIAHNREDAEKFFDKKIKLAFDHIPDDFRRKYCPLADQDRAGQLKFSNGSYITVGTSMRSDTVQFLHVSEFGKMCARFPEKADEVVSGALNAVGPGNSVFIESTGEGAHGHFYDMAMEAKRLSDEDAELSSMDYKFFFYPWYFDPKYELHEHVAVPPEDLKYFKDLERFSRIVLEPPKRNWYSKKRKEQRDRMFREYPSIPEESFRGILDGAPFSRIMAGLRQKGQITRVPWARAVPVNTFWDLGHNDMMAIWFHQRVGFEDRWIDYYEDNFLQLDHYARYLLEKPYTYDRHYLPHDIENTDLSPTDARTRKEILEDLGIKPIIVVPRIRAEQEGVEQTRMVMENCWFDEKKCEQGIRCLENLRYRFDDRLQAFQPNLQRTWAKHGADAFMQWGHGFRHKSGVSREKPVENILARENRASGRMSKTRRLHQHHEKDWRL